jgi:hypothetical protein
MPVPEIRGWRKFPLLSLNLPPLRATAYTFQEASTNLNLIDALRCLTQATIHVS